MSDRDASRKAATEVQALLGNSRYSSKAQGKRQIEDIAQKLKSIGAWPSKADLLHEISGGRLPPGAASAPILNEITNGIMDSAATRVAQESYTRPNSPTSRYVEAQPSARSQMRSVLNGTWRVNSYTKRTKSGKEQIRFQIASDKAILPDEWRHKPVAEMVAAALEQTGGNLGDPRISKIRDLCRQEDEILAEIRNQKRMIEGVDPANSKRHGTHQIKLDEAKNRLNQVRRLLGVS
jgi:hypothetical protein